VEGLPKVKAVDGNRAILWTVLIYAGVELAFTILSLRTSAPGSQTGVFRQLSAIPNHLGDLVGFGIALGLLGSLVYRRLDLNLLVLVPVLVVLTDLDHLPSALGMSQPIRPAHSIIFIVAVVAILALVIRRPDIEAATVAAFFAHLSIDTGQFPAFSPVSFVYYDLSSYQFEMVASAIIAVLVAGYLGRRRALLRRGQARTRNSSASLPGPILQKRSSWISRGVRNSRMR